VAKQGSARRLAGQDDTIRVAAKFGDVVAYPFECHDRVQHHVIAGRAARALHDQLVECEPPKDREPTVQRDNDDVAVRSEACAVHRREVATDTVAATRVQVDKNRSLRVVVV